MPRFGKIAVHLSLWVVLTVGLGFAGQPDPSGDTNRSDKVQSSVHTRPKAVFPIQSYRFEEVYEGTELKYDFVVENQGDAPLVIKNIRPD